MVTTSFLMTTEELLAMPNDGIDRELIRGELKESSITTRGGPHCLVMTNLAHWLGSWLRSQSRPRGRAYAGKAPFRIRRNPDTYVGIDLAYISAELAASTDFSATFVDAPPVLAIEILSPSDTAEDVVTKTREYLSAGVPLVWQVNPYFSTITVYRPDAPPELYNITQELTAGPHLPGFRVSVAEIFEP